MTISFKNDYSEGAHPRLLNALIAANSEQEEGYGLDSASRTAAALIRREVEDDGAAVHFLVGGTQTNLLAISAFLRPHEACICVSSGHIATHETGAIEATGHKLLTVAGEEGKLSPAAVEPVLREHYFEHMVKPALVYISQPTEFGTIYTLEELEELSHFCHRQGLKLYLDGARLGCAVAAGAGVSLAAVYRLTDAFFIGGTKNGALCGEALVVRSMEVKEELRYLIKQRGALLAKGRLLGVQFTELFRDGLYWQLAEHANGMARILDGGLRRLGVAFLLDSPTNQLFPILANEVISALEQEFEFYVWEPGKTHSTIRLVTSWATEKEMVERFLTRTAELLRPEDFSGVCCSDRTKN